MSTSGIWRWYVWLLLIAAAIIAHVGWAEEAGARFGILRGRVLIDAGVPYAGVAVTVTVGEETMTFTAGADGSFMGLVPAGKIHLAVGTVEKDVVIEAGEMNHVDLLADVRGALVSLRFFDGTPATLAGVSTTYFRTPDGAVSASSSPVPVGGARYWFRDCPDNATGISCLIYQEQGDAAFVLRYVRSFPKAETLHKVTFMLDNLVEVRLPIVDAHGTLLPDTPIRGSLRFSQAADPAVTTPSSITDPVKDQHVALNDLRTDGAGRLDFPVLPNQRYEIRLATPSSAGATLAIDVNADGSADIRPYAMAMPIRPIVTQKVFDDTGKPAPAAKVSACYSWLGNVLQQHTVTDAHGVATWKELPPVRVITWGKGLATAVLSPSDTKFIAALPLPIPEPDRSYRFTLANPGEQSATLSWQFTLPVKSQTASSFKPGSKYYPPYIDWQGASGLPLDLIVTTKTKPIRYCYVKDAMLPYIDIDALAVYPVTLEADELAGNGGDTPGEEQPE